MRDAVMECSRDKRYMLRLAWALGLAALIVLLLGGVLVPTNSKPAGRRLITIESAQSLPSSSVASDVALLQSPTPHVADRAVRRVDVTGRAQTVPSISLVGAREGMLPITGTYSRPVCLSADDALRHMHRELPVHASTKTETAAESGVGGATSPLPELLIRKPVASFVAASLYGSDNPWRGNISIASFVVAPPAGAADGAPGPRGSLRRGRLWIVSLTLQRRRLSATKLHTAETADEPFDNASVPLSESPKWQQFFQRHVGPDGFYGVLAGPELVPLHIQRLDRCDDDDGDNAGGVGAASPWDAHRLTQQRNPRNDPITYFLQAEVTTPGVYLMYLEHRFYNHGMFHDRDRFGSSYVPRLILGKRNSMGRAGAIKSSQQRLRLTQATSRGLLDTVVVVAESDGAQSSSLASYVGDRPVDFATYPTVDEFLHRERATANISNLWRPPLCSAAFVRALTLPTSLLHPRSHFEEQGSRSNSNVAPSVSLFALAGRYVGLRWQPATAPTRRASSTSSHSPPALFPVRGWDVQPDYPLLPAGIQYRWQPDRCRLLNSLEEREDAIEYRRPNPSDPKKRLDRQKAAPSVKLDEDECTVINPWPSKFAQCLSVARRGQPRDGTRFPSRHSAHERGKGARILLLGDSQIRSVFHGIVSAVALAPSVVADKVYDARLVLAYRGRCRTRENKKNHHNTSHPGRVALAVETAPEEAASSSTTMAGETLLRFEPSTQEEVTHSRYPLWYASKTSDYASWDHERIVSQVSFVWDPLLLNLSHLSDQCSRDKRRPWNESWTFPRVSRKSRGGSAAADDAELPFEADYRNFGPDSFTGCRRSVPDSHVSPDTRIHPTVRSQIDAADVIVFGLGGWFGIEFWTMEDVELHFVDVIRALRRIVASRLSQGRAKPTLVFLGTTAWPSYVTWDGHRRNTNYRLGKITDVARRMMSSATDLEIVMVPFFELTYTMSHLRIDPKDIHYYGSMVVYTMVDYLMTLLCGD